MTPWLTIVGVGAGGVETLPMRERALLAEAEVVLGPERLLGGLTPTRLPPPSPQGGGAMIGTAATENSLPLEGRDAGRQGGGIPTLVAWQPGLPAMLEQIKSRRGAPTVVLASGDPMWFGVGATLAKHLPAGEIAIHPAPSAFQLAAARLKWPLQHVATLSLHGRPVELLHPHILPGNRLLALTGDRGTIAAARELLLARAYGGSRLTVLENLGAADERITSAAARDFDPAGIGDFHVLAIECLPDPAAPLLPPMPGLPDDAFRHDGQLTKREVRAATLARLAPFPGALLWDVGAGCGSVAIEWMRAARDARAIAFERDEGRCGLIAANAAALGTPGLEIVAGEAPAALAGRPAPDAVFIGGDVANDLLFEACWSALKSGGRLVANAVTLDGEAALYARQEQLGGELTRLEISSLDRIGAERVLRPRLAVTQWAVIKPGKSP
ncbi:MAG TPA: precorrin-6y C5,15-methyltransferase (decarboxylating) subunit CbiE [Devosia sp.]|nr:precorrin-6y C5,15-methyltransferase (decarboxylating) subunit CbiE [Devosia sp.]